MELPKSRVLMLSAPAVAAVLMGAMLVGGMLPNTTDKFSEGLAATGYVTISVVRDGSEIYHYEDHNQLTEAGVDFIVDQVSDSPQATDSAKFVGLTSTDISVLKDDDDATLSGEIDTGGTLDRKAGTFGGYTAATANNDDDYTITAAFTADGTYSNVQGAGLFTDLTPTGDTMVALNNFAAVNLASGDTLTITWTIDLGIDAGLD